MIISIVNKTKSLRDRDVQTTIRAINRQIEEDFEPYWSFGANLRLEGTVPGSPSKEHPQDLRGDGIIYLWDDADVDDALGYHDANNRGIPYGFIFTKLCQQLGESWTVTLSHEALEMVGDSQGNLLVQGPHPRHPNKMVFHWFEMCDAVQSETYEIDGVEVSNFLLPLYFTIGQQLGARNEFLGRRARQKPLQSFGVTPGGYIGYYDPETDRQENYSAPGDKLAQKRIRIKNQWASGRGYVRAHGDALLPKEDAQEEILKSRERKSA
jgi:hypothetical protein